MKDTRIKERSAYEKKITELRGIFDDISKEVSEMTDKKESLRQDILKSASDLENINRQTVLFKSELSKLESDISLKREEYKRNIEDYNASLVFLARQIEDKKSLNCELESSIEAKKNELQSLSKDISVRDNVYQDVDRLRNELGVLSVEINNKIKQSTMIDSDTKTKVDILEDLIKKNGIIRTEIERGLGIIEVYVKRLQRFYDQSGINIQILDQFNIKRDNT